MCTLASRHLAFLAAPGFGALSIVALDIFSIVDLVVTIRTFVGVAVDFLLKGKGIEIGNCW